MGKRNWKQEEMRHLLREYEAKAQDPRVFAKERQMGLSTLFKLIARARCTRQVVRLAEEIRFVEVVPEKKVLVPTRPVEKTDLTFEVPSVGILRFSSLPSPENLGSLIASMDRGRRAQPC